MAIGAAGTITANTTVTNEDIRVEFGTALDNPVIVLSSTQNGGDEFVLRVTGDIIDTDPASDTFNEIIGFTFTIEEWENHDGTHSALEDVHWLAIEEGVHELPDGRVIEAGRADANETAQNVDLNGDFGTDVPVVLTTVSAQPDGNVVDPDPTNVTSSSFDLSVQQGEAYNDVLSDREVGYIVVETGTGTDSGSSQIEVDGLNHTVQTIDLIADFQDPVVLAETQTINGPNPATVVVSGVDAGGTNDTVDLVLVEDTTQDDDGFHVDEDVGIVAFESGLIMCFTADALIETAFGPVRVDQLSAGDFIRTKDNGLQPLRWIGNKTIDAARIQSDQSLQPVKVPKHALAPGVPSKDLVLSQQHNLAITSPINRLLFDRSEVFVPAKFLLSSQILNEQSDVTYYHLMFDAHQIIFANDAPCESLFPGALARDALGESSAQELFKIFPELRTTPNSYGPTARTNLKSSEAKLLAERIGI